MDSGTRRTRTPTATNRIVAGVSVIALLVGATLQAFASSASMHDPSSAQMRLTMAVAWAGIQAFSLISVYAASDYRFAVILGTTTVFGLTVMASGRAGLSGVTSSALLVTVVQVAFLTVAVGAWCAARPVSFSAARTLWRLFYWMSFVGAVYLYAAQPAVAIGHLTAVAVTLIVCSVLSPHHAAMSSLVRRLEHAVPGRLSAAAWCLAFGLLAVNGYWMWQSGSFVPQVRLGPASVAPYFIAVVPIVFALSLDLQISASTGWRRLIGPGLALTAVAAIYAKVLDESGTLAVLLASVTTAMLLVGTTAQAGGLLASVLVLGIALRSRELVDVIAGMMPRVGQRLLAWAGHAAPPDQISRVFEVMGFAGIVGHVGAARLQFLVGPQVSKDYMLALTLANGGWIGLAIVGFAGVLFVLELHRALTRSLGDVARAIQVSILSLIVGNVLVTTMWMGGVAPFAGVPVPVLARAGSHLVALAVFVFLFETCIAAGRPHRGFHRAA